MNHEACHVSVENAAVESSVGAYDPKVSPTESQYTAFARIFRHFNARLFGDKLPPVMLTFSRKSKALGFFAPERWADVGGNQLHEIALNPDHLARRSARDSASTIAHEMAHHWQQCEGKPSRRGYHNAEWANRMEAIGLMPSDTGAPGGKRVGQRMTHYVVDGAAFDQAFQELPAEAFLPFTSSAALTATPKPKDRSKTPFVCEGCGAKAWGKPDLRLVCGDCDEELQPEG